MNNIGYFFYKDYYQKESFNNTVISFDPLKHPEREKEKNKRVKENNRQLFAIKNETLLKTPFDEVFFQKLSLKSKLNRLDSFPLQTTYPGLLLGTGYTHQTGSEGEFKLGFYFDYTSGLPVIPGSSWKGVYRNAFPKFGDKDAANKAEKVFLLCFLLKGITEKDFFDVAEADMAQYGLPANPQADFIHQLEQNIFDGILHNQSQSIYKRDIFFEAIITKGDKKNKIFADDFITPHINHVKRQFSPFTNPTPIMFLKIAPEVQFNFQFRFESVTIKGIEITGYHKMKLCKSILQFFGVGAKTNSGYGQLKDTVLTVPILRFIHSKKKYKLADNIVFSTRTDKKGGIIKATITEIKEDNIFRIQLFTGDATLGYYDLREKEYDLELKQLIAVQINGLTKGRITSLKLYIP